MAKRTRGSHRPGRRAPLRRESGRPSSPTVAPAPRPPSALTREEEARAAEIEAQIVAEERAAEQATRRTRDRGREPEQHVITRLKNSAPLSVRAADEYAYVRRDVRRIARIGGALIAVLAILHVLINVLHVIRF